MWLNRGKICPFFSQLHDYGAYCPTSTASQPHFQRIIHLSLGRFATQSCLIAPFWTFRLTLLWQNLLASAFEIMAARVPNVQPRIGNETDDDEQLLGNDSPYQRGLEAEEEGNWFIPTCCSCDCQLRQIVHLFATVLEHQTDHICRN